MWILSDFTNDRTRPTGRFMGGRRRRPLVASVADRFFVAIVDLGPNVWGRVQSDVRACSGGSDEDRKNASVTDKPMARHRAGGVHQQRSPTV